jgi:acyl-coenzyme A thioesterase PaaI-like protein
MLETVTELPFNQLVGILKGSAPRALVELPAGGQYLNHLGTVHAGAQLVLAEACSGEFLLQNLALDFEVLPVVRRVEAKFKRPANGRLIANVITPVATIVDALAELEGRGRCLVAIAVEIIDESGQSTLAATFDWFIAQVPTK